MTIAHTSSFLPISAKVLHDTIRSWGLSEDLGVRPAATPGHVIVYALEGASSWPYERTIGDDQEEFDIVDFLGRVAQRSQEIEAHEHGESVHVTMGTPLDPNTPGRPTPDF